MKAYYHIGGGILCALALANCGCSSSPNDLKGAYQRGFAAGKTSQIRQSYHDRQAANPDIIVDGKAVAKRNAEVFTPEIAARRSLDHYREVRSSALQQRKRIKAEIETSLQQLRIASTSSEVAKLNTLIRALEAQLSANDREIQFAASEVLTRHLHNQVEEQIQAKARVQQQRATLKVGTKKDLRFYRLPSKPLFFKR